MFHCNGWGGVFALTGDGRHARRPARGRRRRRSIDLIERREGDLRLHGAGRAEHDPQLSRTRRKHNDHDAAALHRRRRAAARRLHRAAREGARLGVHPDLRPHRDRADPHRLAARLSRRATDGLRAPRARGRRGASASSIQVLDDDGSRVPQDDETHRRGVRALERRPQGLLGAAGGDREGDPRRLLPHRRPRRLGRVRQHPHRRPQEGRDHLRRREHQLAGDRGRALPAPRRARVRRDRRAAREVGRDAEGAHRAARRARRATRRELIAFCREHLAHFKCPTSVDFVEALPRTATGKLQKFVLREQYWEGRERKVAG